MLVRPGLCSRGVDLVLRVMIGIGQARAGPRLVEESSLQACPIPGILQGSPSQGHNRRENFASHQAESRCGRAQVRSNLGLPLLLAPRGSLLLLHLLILPRNPLNPSFLKGPHRPFVNVIPSCLFRYLKQVLEDREIMLNPQSRGQMRFQGRRLIGRDRLLTGGQTMLAPWRVPCLQAQHLIGSGPTGLEETPRLRAYARQLPTVLCRGMRRMSRRNPLRRHRSASGRPCFPLSKPVVTTQMLPNPLDMTTCLRP